MAKCFLHLAFPSIARRIAVVIGIAGRHNLGHSFVTIFVCVPSDLSSSITHSFAHSAARKLCTRQRRQLSSRLLASVPPVKANC
jgi:hypothetical protein